MSSISIPDEVNDYDSPRLAVLDDRLRTLAELEKALERENSLSNSDVVFGLYLAVCIVRGYPTP